MSDTENKNKRPQVRSLDFLTLEPFSGKPEEFDKYFKEYKSYANASGWGETEMTRRLPLYLKGYTLQAFNTLDPQPTID